MTNQLPQSLQTAEVMSLEPSLRAECQMFSEVMQEGKAVRKSWRETVMVGDYISQLHNIRLR